VACGLWFVVCGLWFVVCGLKVRESQSKANFFQIQTAKHIVCVRGLALAEVNESE
jgi:hypothetical protein